MEGNKLGDRLRAKELNYKGHELFEWCACVDCGKERWVLVKRGKAGTLRCRNCAQKHRAITIRGDNHQCWRGGVHRDNGYTAKYIPRGHKFESMLTGNYKYVLQHRLVMAEYLGRPLTKHELVHHKDGNRSNNDISNLELTHRGKHEKDHSKGYRDGFNKGYMDGFNKAKREGL